MPFDHYVSQVHLRRFNSPALGERMYALRKSDLKSFEPSPRDVCRIMDGSTNSYLSADRAIEDFLKTIEPMYNPALDKLVSDRIDIDAIYAIAGFAAFVSTCSPAAMRFGVDQLAAIVKSTTRGLDAMGLLPEPPKALSGNSLTSLLDNGQVRIEVDPKYPQAIGIANVVELTKMFGNFPWEILHNEFHDSLFFTSDFPVAVERTPDLRVVNRLIPLSPNLAVRICPDIDIDRERCDLSFGRFRYRHRKMTRKDIAQINTTIVRCAETEVYYRDAQPWVPGFVKKHRGYRIEAQTHEFAQPSGSLLVTTQRVVEYSQVS